MTGPNFDARIELPDGVRLDWTCQNNKFQTDYQRHAIRVFDDGTNTLRLEPVLEKGHFPSTPDEELYWFMWYDNASRKPSIKVSAIFSRAEVKRLAHEIIDRLP